MCLIAPVITTAQKTSKAAPLCDKAKQCLKVNDFDKALRYLDQAQLKDPNYADVYIMKGDIYNIQLRSDSAYKNYSGPLISLAILIRCYTILLVMRVLSAAPTLMP